MSQGSAANKSGKLGESLCGVVMRHYGIGFVPQHRPGFLGLLEERVCIDFYVPRATGFEEGLYVEARWQDSCGSIDKKIPTLVSTINLKYDRPTVLMIDGEATEKARAYALKNLNPRLIAAMTFPQFIVFAKSVSLGSGETFVLREFNPSQMSLFRSPA